MRFYDGKATHTIGAVGHVAASSHSHPFDTALRAYSGQAVDLQETALRGHAVGYVKGPL